jgi:hypothetical protein
MVGHWGIGVAVIQPKVSAVVKTFYIKAGSESG